jgi:acetate kinase
LDAALAAHVLALNSGSSSLKFGLYRVTGPRVDALLAGELERGDGPPATSDGSVRRIAAQLAASQLPAPQAIGHRVVHGGPQLRAHGRIDAALLQTLTAAADFAPLHTPATLAVMHEATACFPGLPQVACFDTTFHANMPDVATVLALPRALRAEGIQRYGFHGLSCESIVHQLGDGLPRRLLIAHLGNGASVTAVQDGRSIDTSMGLTPSGGLIMGTRSGDLDPGAVVHLLRTKRLDAAGLEDLIDRESGLLGISGLSGDLRRLHAAAPANADADLALRMFSYSAAKTLAAMAAALGGVDLIVFTGGIGENDSAVRAAICSRLACIGVRLDDERNAHADDQPTGLISTATARCPVRVLPSAEDEQIARHTAALAF